jgi:type IV pilus assembly protein PilA
MLEHPPRPAFTLIELLVVVVIIGVLAAIAIPKFATAKNRAYVQTMRSDLRTLMGAQMMFRQEQQPATYASDLAQLGTNYRPSSGVTVTITQGDAAGFAATATHSASSTTCAVFRGNAVAAPATVEGEIACQ